MTHHAITTVQTFLNLMAARELSQAASYLDSDAIMIFPGGNTFTSLTAFAQWAKSRYQNIDKTIDSFTSSSTPIQPPSSIATVVYEGTGVTAVPLKIFVLLTALLSLQEK